MLAAAEVGGTALAQNTDLSPCGAARVRPPLSHVYAEARAALCSGPDELAHREEGRRAAVTSQHNQPLLYLSSILEADLLKVLLLLSRKANSPN